MFYQPLVFADESDEFQLLVIIDQENDQSSLPDFPDYIEPTVIRMKAFVASREELDGKYDGIYIHNGSYSSDVPTIDPPLGQDTLLITRTEDRRSHYQTTNKMNDITSLKANEIINDFIKKGQPVILHSNIFNQSCSSTTLPAEGTCVLKKSFEPYRNNSTYPNVKVYNNNSSIFSNLVNTRPIVNLVTSPIPYENGESNKKYVAGEEINFTFTVDSQNTSSLKAQLYIDTDYNSRFDNHDLIVEKNLSALPKNDNEYTLTYKVPKGFSGIRIWKLEIIDPVHKNLKDYETGVFRFDGEKVEVRVLQITQDSNNAGSLKNVLKENIISGKNGNVIETDFMKITIDVTDLYKFNTGGYRNINGAYNMLIFGFQDEYGKVDISSEAANEVKKFIETKQSVFFTHDTLRRDRRNGGNTLLDSNNWFRVFMDISGQTVPVNNNSKSRNDTPTEKPAAFYLETNLGRGGSGVYSVTKANQVNNGLRTEFPYDIGDISIVSTHAQYFALNLNDKDVMTWYNLDHSGLDKEDSWNLYYAYSIGSLTYSGAGHTNSSFSAEEQKLFVNLMYQSFLGSNHAPAITLYTPLENGAAVKPTKNLDVVYKLEDLDLNDFNLQTRVYVKGQQDPNKIPFEQAYTGAVINKTIDKSLLKGDSITIVIEATDESGARVVKEVVVKIDRSTPTVSADRVFAQNNGTYLKTATSSQAVINYSVQSQNFSMEGFVGEVLYPFALDSFNKPVGSTITLPDEPFGGWNKAILDLDERAIDLEVLNGYRGPEFKKDQKVKFEQGYHTGDWHKNLDKLIGKELIIPVINTLTDKIIKFAKVKVTETIKNGSNTRARATVIGYQDAYYSSPRLSNVTIKEVFPEGIEVVNIPNGFTKTIQNKQTVVTGNINPFTFDLEGRPTGVTTQTFSITVKPTKDQVYLLNNSNVTFTNPSGESTSSAFDTLTLESYTAVESVTILDGDQSLRATDPAKLLTVEVKPTNAAQGVIWSSSAPDIVSVDQNGSIKALKPGQATITVKSVEYDPILRPNLLDSIQVSVDIPVESISIQPGELKLKQGDTESIQAIINPSNATNQNVRWSVQDTNIVSINPSGKTANLTGKELGETTITVTSDDGNKQAQIKVTVVPNIVISPDVMRLQVDETKSFSVNLSDKSLVTWSIVDSSKATIDSKTGAVKGLKVGETKVRATYTKDSSVYDEVTLIVEANLESIRLPQNVNILVGETVTLVPEVNPGRPSDYELIWSSGNTNIATISNNSGVLTGVSLGKTIVTVREKITGKTAQTQVTVVEEYTEEHPPLDDRSVRW